METTEPVVEPHGGGRKTGTERMEIIAIGIVGALVLLALGVQIGMGLGHAVPVDPLADVAPVDSPVSVADIGITQGPPEGAGYRSWIVDATVGNTGLIPTGPITMQLDFDDASVVSLRAYRTEARGAANRLAGGGAIASLLPHKTSPVFLSGDDRTNAYRKFPAALEVVVHHATYRFPLPKPPPSP